MIIPMVSLVPVILFPGREPAWTIWVLVLTQNQMLGKILKGAKHLTAVGVSDCGRRTDGGVSVYTARKMRQVVSVVTMNLPRQENRRCACAGGFLSPDACDDHESYANIVIRHF
jgi:hypothetical protein